MLLLCLSVFSYAQKMSVASFRMDEADQTANFEPTMKYDRNGDKCALIKIISTQKKFTFDVGTLAIEDVEWQNSKHPGEIWVYVQYGANKITIQHPQFGIIRDYDLGQRLQKGRTYVMSLTTDQVNTVVVDYDNSQVLEMEVEPKNAEVFINGLRQTLDSKGRLSMELPFGTHNYRVVAENYHPEESQFEVNDKKNHHRLKVRLRQAFGYLNVNSTSESSGAQLFVDDRRVGEIPVTRMPVSSGSHKITVYKELYTPFNETVMVNDSATVSITPRLVPNSAEYEIIVDGDSDALIYDNGKLLGKGQWKGRLEAGEHTIEATRAAHSATRQTVNVVKNVPRKVSLSRPVPVYGGLEITTQPTNAEIYIDGVNAGRTEYINRHVLVGRHSVRLVKPGYRTEEFEVDIREGQTERIGKTLTNFCDLWIYSSPNGGININGNYEGRTPYHFTGVAGTYHVEIAANGYTKYSKKLKLDGNTGDISVKLRRDYIRRNEFYIQGGYNFKGFSGINVGLGFYASNLNVEGNYIFALSKSETIYWNDMSSDSAPYQATYEPMGGNVKIGYGIRLHNRFRITPQIGGQFLKLKEKLTNAYITEDYNQWTDISSIADGAGAACLSFGLRINVAIVSCLGLSVTPEYLMPISKSDGYKALSAVSPVIKGYSEGIACNVSLNLFF